MAAAPFSVRVADAAWRAAAEEWVRERLGASGIRVDGIIERSRIRPWSTQLTIPTSSGLFWFKANQPSFGFEAALQSELARLAPDAVQAPLAVDRERGWMLTADHGRSISDEAPPTADEWEMLLRGAARLQRVLAAHRSGLLSIGLPYCAPVTVPARFDRLRSALRAYPAGHPGHLSPALDARLAAARPAVVAACAALDASAFPSTWNHGDLHPQNAYRDGSEVRLFDLGDGQWSNALEILAVPQAWMRYHGLAADISRVTAAYAAEWDATVSDELLRAMRIVHAVNRSQTWWSWLVDTTPDELERFGREPEEHLTSVLDVIAR